ncbi:hypothetical protein CKO_03546 [Citrobacter koseri ATCC BAA-895]|uniref:Uncharacterized protein n=1 Tax=Citrobacter koseri (strain ATCC BAA-895 / CDC 4225-83 / SGSC4696) TaxID=290338 RepID=A8AMB2_CITK8|nr:hypothetical protein CKO_03546 [Citrobacter koseri ATCC BAA-895]
MVIFDTTLFSIMQDRDNGRGEFSSLILFLCRIAQVLFFEIILFFLL